MRAARLHRYGGPDELVVEEVPLPRCDARQVLIRIHAAAVNPVDWKIRGGAQRAVIRLKLPFILGMDLSGVIVAIGADVRGFAVGDEVYSSPHHKIQGCYAEYVAVDAAQVARRPASISHIEAAGVPMVGLTAWRCLVTAGHLQAGQKVVITAGAGGVGSIAIQIAKALGAYVATTCSERNRQFVEELGADEVLDYRSQRVDDVLSGYDLALDVYGGDDTARLRRVLKRGGRLVAITGDLPGLVKRYGPILGVGAMIFRTAGMMLSSRLFHGITARHVVRRPDGSELAELTTLIERGAVKPIVDRVFPLEQIADAHRYSESGRARGKIIVAVVPAQSDV